MAKNFYAVRRGTKIGIFTSWAECQSAVTGYSGAQYKGFNTEAEAEAYMNGNEVALGSKGELVKIERPENEYTANIFVDGSYKEDTVSFGIYIQAYDRDYKFDGALQTKKYNDSRNIAGELFAVLSAVQVAIQLGYSNLKIFHDYVGSAKFLNGEWTPKGELSQKYRSLMNNFRLNSNLSYDFMHVKGHSGIVGNTTADKLAVRAINLKQYVDPDLILNGVLGINNLYTSNM